MLKWATRSDSIAGNNSSLPDKLNALYTYLNQSSGMTLSTPTASDSLLQVSMAIILGFTDIFNHSILKSPLALSSAVSSQCQGKAVCLNDYHPVALPSTIIKWFERSVMEQTQSSFITVCYRRNTFTTDIISLALHSPLEHLDNNDTYVRLLLTVNSSAFNTNIPIKLISNPEPTSQPSGSSTL